MARISGATHRTRITRGRVALISNRICRVQRDSRCIKMVKICQDGKNRPTLQLCVFKLLQKPLLIITHLHQLALVYGLIIIANHHSIPGIPQDLFTSQQSQHQKTSEVTIVTFAWHRLARCSCVPCTVFWFSSPGAESAEPQPCAARGAEERSIAARPKRGRSTAEHS